MTEIAKLQLQPPKQTNLTKTKSVTTIVNYTEKLTEAVETNTKLKELMQTIRNNAVHKKIQTQLQSEIICTEQQLGKLRKKQGKLFNEIEQLTNSLNVLINQNYKLKEQVNSSRNSRVIYSNVYKNLEKEIRKNQYLYKKAIIEGLTFQEIELRVKEKVEKVAKKIEKEINQLQGIDMSKKKQKSRLDTGLSTYRAHKLGSKETNRYSSKEEITHKALQTKRDDIICESKKQTTRRNSRKMSVLKYKQEMQKLGQSVKTDKSLKSRNKIQIAEQINEYFNLQMKSNYYDNFVMQMAKICGQNSLKQIIACWKNIQSEIEGQFKDYTKVQGDIKEIERKIQEFQVSSIMPTRHDLGDRSSEERELQETEQQIVRQQLKVSELEQYLSTKIDFNCSKLTNQDISRHILRMKNEKQISARELQKLLESVCKERSGSLMYSRLSQTCK